MQKKEFIQRLMIRTTPPLEKVAVGVRYAESLWHKLSELGYGTPNHMGQRESIDWCRRMDEQNQQWFALFWNAFKYKKGRNEAAKSWGKIENITPTLAEQIIQAAGKEAMRSLPSGQSRKMAAGWLNELRWNDCQTSSKPAKSIKMDKIQALELEVVGLKRINQTGALDRQIAALEQQIQELSVD